MSLFKDKHLMLPLFFLSVPQYFLSKSGNACSFIIEEDLCTLLEFLA